MGYAKSCRDVLEIAQQVFNAHNPDRDVELTEGRWDRFSKRHLESSLRQAEPLRMPEQLPTTQKSLKHTLINGLAHCPGQIFNCDETGMPLTQKPPKVVAGVGQKHVYTVTSGDRVQITVMACAGARGYSLPPMAIFDLNTWS